MFRFGFQLTLILALTTVLAADDSLLHALDCISACYNLQQAGNQETCLRCYEDPPLVDVMCLFACGHQDKNFALKGICATCEADPPCTDHLLEFSCQEEHTELRSLCETCVHKYT